jgi:hypothetical protein
MAEWTKADFDKFYRFHGTRYGIQPHQQMIWSHYNVQIVGLGQISNAQFLLPNITGNVIVFGAGFGWTVEGLQSHGVNAAGTEVSGYILGAKDTNEEADLRGYIIDAGRDPDNDWVICLPDHPNAIYMEDPNKRLGETDQWVSGLFEWMCHPIQLMNIRPGARALSTIADEDSTTNGSRRAVTRLLGSIDTIITEEVLNSIPDAEALALCENLAKYDKPVIHILSPLRTLKKQEPSLNWKSYADWQAFLAPFPNQKILASATHNINSIPYEGVGQDPDAVIAYGELI